MAQQATITVVGVEQSSQDNSLPYTSEADGCDEVLVVLVDTETIRVPITNLSCSAVDFWGDVPDSVTMTAVWADGPDLHAHTVVDGDHYVELTYNTSHGRGGWALHGDVVKDTPENATWSPEDAGFKTLWERDE